MTIVYRGVEGEDPVNGCVAVEVDCPDPSEYSDFSNVGAFLLKVGQAIPDGFEITADLGNGVLIISRSDLLKAKQLAEEKTS